MKGAIFDWDGTLASIDDREFYCINHALSEQGSGPITKKFYIDNYYRRAYELGTGPRMVLKTALASKDEEVMNRAYESYRKIFQDTADKATLQKGALQILEALRHNGFKIGIATMRYTRWVVESELVHLNVAPLVHLLKTRQDIGVGGTFGSLQEAVGQRVRLVTAEISELGLDLEGLFLVGDSWWDIRAGKQLGIKTVLVRTGFAAFNDFSNEGPSLVTPSLLELRESLELKHWTI